MAKKIKYVIYSVKNKALFEFKFWNIIAQNLLILKYLFIIE